MIPTLCFTYLVSYTFLDPMFSIQAWRNTVVHLTRKVRGKNEIDTVIAGLLKKEEVPTVCIISLTLLNQNEVNDEQAIELWGEDWKSRL